MESSHSALPPSWAATPSTADGSSIRITSAVGYKVRTVAVREDMLVWVQSGSKTLLGPQAPAPCTAGTGLLLPRGSQWDLSHAPAAHGLYVAQVLSFTRELVREAATLYPLASAQLVRGAAVMPVETELADTFTRAARALTEADSSRALQRHRLLEVLLLLAERGLRFDTGNELGWDERLRQRIAQRPHENWTIDALARAFHTSASTLRRRIADSGITLGELVREVRLETALTLLQSSALPVGDIAARCGYGSHSRFSAAFRSRFGLAPSELRPEPHRLNSEAHSLARTG